MTPQQDVLQLREVKIRLERVLDYYREFGDQGRGFMQSLEAQLCIVVLALETGGMPLKRSSPGMLAGQRRCAIRLSASN